MTEIADGVLPASVIDAARIELRKLLETPEVAVAGRQRARLTKRLEQLQKQHAWGDLTDAEYLAQRDATRANLAELPDGDRIRTFDAYRARVLALPDAIEAASPHMAGCRAAGTHRFVRRDPRPLDLTCRREYTHVMMLDEESR